MLLMDYNGLTFQLDEFYYLRVSELSDVVRNAGGELVHAHTYAVLGSRHGVHEQRLSHAYPDMEHAQSALVQFTRSPTPLFFWKQPSTTTKKRRRKTWKPQESEWTGTGS